MEIVKFDRIVSVNSEIQNHEARLLLESHIGLDKSWLCDKGSAKAIVILKLDRSSVPVKVDIGNASSALIEVQVGRATNASDDFQVLVPTSTFMSPIEAKTGQNKNQVRFFTTNDFDPNAVGKQWDLLKIVCSQPFDKHVSYGICFVTLHAEKSKTTSLLLKQPDETNLSIGSFFRKRNKPDEEKEKPLSISDRIRKAEKPSALATHVPLTASKISTKVDKLPEPSPKRRKTDDEKPGAETKIVTPKADSETKKRHRRPEEGASSSRRDSSDISKRKREEQAKLKEDIEDRRKEKDTSKAKRKRKPFEKLLEDVVFVLSGYQNPERGIYRSHAIAMGAKYRPDWRDNECTHLIAAYINTPKCNQVKGKGKIVGKDWLEKCYNDKKRYPWRRFALDKNDKRQPESEEEIDAGADSSPSPPPPPAPSTSRPSTSKESISVIKKLFSAEEDDDDDDDDNDDDSDAYNLPTDEEEPESSAAVSLPDFFQGLSFYVDDSIADRSVLERYIIAYNGVLHDKVDKVDFLVTFQRGSALQKLKGHANNIKTVSPTWIQSVNCAKKFIPATNFLID